MKTSFSVNVTGSITVSIEPSNEDGGVDVDDDNSGNVLVDVLLKSLIDAIKKHAGDKGTPTIEEEEEDISSPLPQRRVPLDADAADDDDDDDDDDDGDEEDEEDDDDDDSTVDPDASNDEDEDQVSELPNIEIDNEYEEDNQLSQKMGLMSLRRRD